MAAGAPHECEREAGVPRDIVTLYSRGRMLVGALFPLQARAQRLQRALSAKRPVVEELPSTMSGAASEAAGAGKHVKPTPADERSPSPIATHRAEPLLNLVAEDGPAMETVAVASMMRVIKAVLERVASQGAARGLSVLVYSFQDNVLQEDDGSIRLGNGAAFVLRVSECGRFVRAGLVSRGRAYGDAAYGDALALHRARDRRAGAERGRTAVCQHGAG